MRPILFLDIDGVLNTPHTFPRFDEKAVDNFNAVIRQLKPRIVISSSWRYSINPKTMTTTGFEILMFSQGIVMPEGSIIGKTKSDEEVSGRENQIKEWLRRNAYEGSWVVLDDLPLSIPENNFVRTHKGVGLSTENTRRIIQLLSSD